MTLQEAQQRGALVTEMSKLADASREPLCAPDPTVIVRWYVHRVTRYDSRPAYVGWPFP